MFFCVIFICYAMYKDNQINKYIVYLHVIYPFFVKNMLHC